MGVLPASISALSHFYPIRSTPPDPKYATVQVAMKDIAGTPCCVQMSYAFNSVGITVPARSRWRANVRTQDTISGSMFYFMLAVDEVEKFLTEAYGEGELLNKDLAGKPRTGAERMKYIADRPGLLTFRSRDIDQFGEKGVFEHTELWTGSRMLQGSATSLFDSKFVKFWDTNDTPKWLTQYMATVS